MTACAAPMTWPNAVVLSVGIVAVTLLFVAFLAACAYTGGKR